MVLLIDDAEILIKFLCKLYYWSNLLLFYDCTFRCHFEWE